jgi:hypothetical protein
VVGIIVLLYVFITLMWFPSVFLGTLWAVLVLIGSAFIASIVTLGVYNLLGKIAEDDEDTDEE